MDAVSPWVMGKLVAEELKKVELELAPYTQ